MNRKFSLQSVADRLNYWRRLHRLKKAVAVMENLQQLNILAGDSLSAWFPTDLLPSKHYWLKQAIAGDTSAMLLQRLEIFGRSQPSVILIMIGINDIICGQTDETILENYQKIISHLQQVHPQAEISIQSILPHSGGSWDRQNELLSTSNTRIRQLNQQLQAIATTAGIKYLDLHPIFADSQGNLRSELTTDGLHLSRAGYQVWRSALQSYTTAAETKE